jgi:hypothetical protein
LGLKVEEANGLKKHNKLLHPTHTAPRFFCISLRYILSTKTALQHVRLSKALWLKNE